MKHTKTTPERNTRGWKIKYIGRRARVCCISEAIFLKYARKSARRLFLFSSNFLSYSPFAPPVSLAGGSGGFLFLRATFRRGAGESDGMKAAKTTVQMSFLKNSSGNKEAMMKHTPYRLSFSSSADLSESIYTKSLLFRYTRLSGISSDLIGRNGMCA